MDQQHLKTSVATRLVGPPASGRRFHVAGHRKGPVRRLRVLVHAGIAALQCPGGGEVQLIKTAEYLRRSGVHAKLFNPWRDRLREADCLHLFGTLREHLPLVETARRVGTPVVLSTIAWYDLRACWHLADGWAQRVSRSGRFALRAAAPRLPSWRRRLYDGVDLLLPNSRAEGRQLTRYFGVAGQKMHVVPNGADLPQEIPQEVAHEMAHEELFEAMYGLRGFALCPGRIEPRKNQLTLLRALASTDVPVVILGDPVPGYRDYAQGCRQAAGSTAHFIPALPRNSPLLASAYRCSACVVLPGWFETPGLAALEAAFAAVPVVVTRIGAAPEYFGNSVRYVHPNRPREIAAAVREAMGDRCGQAERLERLSRRVRRRYSWTRVAEVTREAYERVV